MVDAFLGVSVPVSTSSIYAITMGAAYVLKMDHVVGSISAGKFADFACSMMIR